MPDGGHDMTELKGLIEKGNREIEAARKLAEEAKSTATADAVKADELRKAHDDLAATFKAKGEVLTKIEARLTDVEKKAGRPGGLGDGTDPKAEEHKAAFVEWMRDPSDSTKQAALKGVEKKAADVRTLAPGSGGFAVPEVIAREIVRQVQDVSPIRQIARVVTVGTSDYKELVDTRGFGAEWVGETDARAQTNTPDLEEVAPTFGMLHAKPQATVESLEDVFFDVPSWLIASASEEFAKAEGAAFVAGNGTKKPTGFLAGTPTDEADGARAFGTLQYVATGQAAALAASPFDTLITLIYTLKAGYRSAARFVMNSSTMASLALAKDTEDRYLLQMSVAEGMPDRVWGYPVTSAEDMPNVGADAFPIAFGDFRRGYLIADRAGLRIVRDEVTLPGYVRWQVYRRVGGAVKDSNAIKLLKVAAS